MKPTEDRPENLPKHVHEDQQPALDSAHAGHDSTVQHPRPVESGLEAEFEDCIELIDRVKQHSPECLTDQTSDNAGHHGNDALNSRECDLPKKIGRFQIEALVGVGGFGLVYRAVDPDLGRTVSRTAAGTHRFGRSVPCQYGIPAGTCGRLRKPWRYHGHEGRIGRSGTAVAQW